MKQVHMNFGKDFHYARAENLDSVTIFLSQEESQKPPTHKINRSIHNPDRPERLFKEKEKFVEKCV